jgi:polycomb protein EED
MRTRCHKNGRFLKEDHGREIYCVQIYNSKNPNPDKLVFATVGSNRCSIYEYIPNEEIEINLLQSHMDADSKEIFYTCCWTNDSETNEPLLIVAGFKGIIRSILYTNKKDKLKHALFGHGSSVNDLRVYVNVFLTFKFISTSIECLLYLQIHPSKKTVLLSSSKDYTLRLWNLKTNVCIGILGGCDGHRSEVLSAVSFFWHTINNANYFLQVYIFHFFI